jgi:hypothetical protein
LPKENNRPLGKNSPNLVTLVVRAFKLSTFLAGNPSDTVFVGQANKIRKETKTGKSFFCEEVGLYMRNICENLIM